MRNCDKWFINNTNNYLKQNLRENSAIINDLSK